MHIAPTKGQVEFVQDFESGISALRMQGVRITTIKQIMEAAGYELADFSGYVNRLQSQNCWDMILKVKDMIESIGMKIPTSIARALDYLPPDRAESGSAALTLQLEPFPQPKVRASARPEIEIEFDTAPTQSPSNPDRVREVIIDMLNPLQKTQQVRIIDTVARWFGVGT